MVEALTDSEQYAVGEPVRMTLKVLNGGVPPVRLNFTSAQRYDFIVYKDDREVWRWSQDKMLAQAIGSLTLNPGERKVYTASWIAAGSPGSYRLAGVITSSPSYKACCTLKIVGEGLP